VAELRGTGDAPEDGDAPARRFAEDAGNHAGEVRPRYEPSPRAEYADVIREKTGQANAGQADASQVDKDQIDTAQVDTVQGDADQADAAPEHVSPKDPGPEDAGPEEAGQSDTARENTGQADADQGDGYRPDSDQVGVDQAEPEPSAEGSNTDALERFDPRRAGLPEVSRAEAAAYIEEHQAERPWLATARDCSPEAQRVFVTLDQGHGHAHIRHDGYVTEEMNERRVRNLEDPAQLDPEKREAGIDGLKSGNQPHRCGDIATRITDPEAFATAFARGLEHPDVRAALDSPVPVPRPVELPISEVLGEGGYKFCSGWQLEPVNGSMLEAVANREAWMAGDRDVAEPRARPVRTFDGGTVTYVFRPGVAGGHEIITMYVNPPDEQSTYRQGGET
jgi:hypothetical protein